MATFLDIGILKSVGDIFPMLLVFLVVFGVLTYTKTFKENKGLQAMISFVLAIMVLFVPNLVDVIKLMSPWFTVMIIFIVFILLLYKMFGASDEMIKDILSPKKSTVVTWILVISAIILIGSLGKVYFSGSPTSGTNVTYVNGSLVTTGNTGATGQGAFWATLFHPKVLGMLMVLIIATFAIVTLTVEVK